MNDAERFIEDYPGTRSGAILRQALHDRRAALDRITELEAALDELGSLTATNDDVRAAFRAGQDAALDDALYLAQAATHLLDHLAAEKSAFYCEDLDNVRHFAARIKAYREDTDG